MLALLLMIMPLRLLRLLHALNAARRTSPVIRQCCLPSICWPAIAVHFAAAVREAASRCSRICRALRSCSLWCRCIEPKLSVDTIEPARVLACQLPLLARPWHRMSRAAATEPAAAEHAAESAKPAENEAAIEQPQQAAMVNREHVPQRTVRLYTRATAVRLYTTAVCTCGSCMNTLAQRAQLFEFTRPRSVHRSKLGEGACRSRVCGGVS